MFFATTLITKGKPLFNVWIAVGQLDDPCTFFAYPHHAFVLQANGTKLKKGQLDKVDCTAIADLILNPKEQLALRFTAHLLGGAVRVLGWKWEALDKDSQAARSKLPHSAPARLSHPLVHHINAFNVQVALMIKSASTG